jgi:SAM-dependent MidA family methyltransferase
MALALGHPTLGYYTTRDPFGAAGDFTTAPEISQMFGELIGLWAAVLWRNLGCPAALRLVELGPGRGTLMADALRAAKSLPRFHAAIHVDLVETSPRLREIQRRALADCTRPVFWHDALDSVPAGPMILIANEFFDALPARQYVRTARGWCERCVGLDGASFVFGVRAEPEPALLLQAPLLQALLLQAPQGSLLERGVAARRMARAIGQRLARQGGAALVIDYGYEGPRLGESLQAVKAHRAVDPLETPGQADLTVHVDFADLGHAARAAGAEAWGLVPQGEFLVSLGIEARAAALQAQAQAPAAEAVASGLRRLVEAGGPQAPGMGRLFKVLALTGRGLGCPPGFAWPMGARA